MIERRGGNVDLELKLTKIEVLNFFLEVDSGRGVKLESLLKTLERDNSCDIE